MDRIQSGGSSTAPRGGSTKRRVAGRLRRTGVVAVVAAAALVGSTGAASAATGQGYAYGPEVFGSANWEWTKSGWTNGNAAVRDTKCDGEPVYIRFQVQPVGSPAYFTVKRFNQQGCGETSSWPALWHDAGKYVRSVRVVTCVDDAGNDADDTCYYSSWQDNPLT